MWSEIGEALLPKLLHLKTKKFNTDDSKTLQTDNVSCTHSCMHMYKDREINTVESVCIRYVFPCTIKAKTVTKQHVIVLFTLCMQQSPSMMQKQVGVFHSTLLQDMVHNQFYLPQENSHITNELSFLRKCQRSHVLKALLMCYISSRSNQQGHVSVSNEKKQSCWC